MVNMKCIIDSEVGGKVLVIVSYPFFRLYSSGIRRIDDRIYDTAFHFECSVHVNFLVCMQNFLVDNLCIWWLFIRIQLLFRKHKSP